MRRSWSAFGSASPVERHPLEHVERCGAVVQPDHDDGHGLRLPPIGPSASPATLRSRFARSPTRRTRSDVTLPARRRVAGRRFVTTAASGPVSAPLVEAEDLQLDREIDLADGHARGHREDDRGEVQDRRDPRRDQPVRRLLRGRRRRGDDTDGARRARRCPAGRPGGGRRRRRCVVPTLAGSTSTRPRPGSPARRSRRSWRGRGRGCRRRR